MPRWNRIDPPTCGCTDCIIGWSIPVDDLTADDVEWIARFGLTKFEDATAMTAYEWDHYRWPWED